MESPNRIAKIPIGSAIGTGVASGMPTRSPIPADGQRQHTEAAALESRFITTAFSGTTTDRKTIISNTNDASSTLP